MNSKLPLLTFSVPGIFRPGNFRWVGWFVFMMGACFACQTASASCGDYLHGHDRANPARYGVIGAEDLASRELSGPGSGRVPDSRRCSGPSCQSAPELPFEMPKAEFVRATLKDICRCEILDLSVGDQWCFADRSAAFFVESRISAPLERPPRIA